MTNPSSMDMDAVLDAALDELDDDDDDQQQQRAPATAHSTVTKEPSRPTTQQKTAAQTTRPVAGPPRPPPPQPPAMSNEFEQMMQMLQQQPDLESDAVFEQLLQQMQSQMQSELSDSTSDRDDKNKSKKRDSVNDAIDALVGDIHQRQQEEHNFDDNDNINPQDILQQLLQGMSMQGDDNMDNTSPDALVESMMQQLLAKDLMYEPMKQVATKFPDWLHEKKESLSETEYEQRCQQYQCFQKLVHVYETDPTNTTQLMTLMQDVQEYGQPPNEIVQDIAPGLQWDDVTGMPKMEGSEECPIM